MEDLKKVHIEDDGSVVNSVLETYLTCRKWSRRILLGALGMSILGLALSFMGYNTLLLAYFTGVAAGCALALIWAEYKLSKAAQYISKSAIENGWEPPEYQDLRNRE